MKCAWILWVWDEGEWVAFKEVFHSRKDAEYEAEEWRGKYRHIRRAEPPKVMATAKRKTRKAKEGKDE